MGSQPPDEGDAPQQALPPCFTRRAASPYFSRTASLIAELVSFDMMILLLTDLNDRLRVNGAAARAALGVKELEQFLKSRGVRGVAKKRAFAFDKHQIFGLQLFEMMGEGGVRNVEFGLNISDNQAFGMRGQQ